MDIGVMDMALLRTATLLYPLSRVSLESHSENALVNVEQSNLR
jgi:hypothetical protein